MKFNELDIQKYIGFGDRRKAFDAGEHTKPLIIHLAGILDLLHPQGDDNLHTIWAKVPRPTFRQYCEFHYGYDLPYHKANEKTIKKIQKEYEENYPTPKVWHRISVKHFTREVSTEFYGFFIDNNYLFSINDCSDNSIREGTDLLDWAISEADAFVREVLNGTYKKNVLNKIPFVYREGKIRRSDLWKAYPVSKRRFFRRFNRNALKDFSKNFKSGKPDIPLLPNMTARTFYEACAVVYNSLGMHGDTKTYKYQETDMERIHYGGIVQTPKELYYALADGRDDGLKNVPMDDPVAFKEWRDRKGPYYEFNGSHPWEIIHSSSISNSLHLIPRGNSSGECYFDLSGESPARMPDTIIAANALYEAGIPFKINGLDKIFARIEGTDYIPVVPISESAFFGDCIHLPKGVAEALVAKETIWEFEEYKLK
jgi:hypothetical protein